MALNCKIGDILIARFNAGDWPLYRVEDVRLVDGCERCLLRLAEDENGISESGWTFTEGYRIWQKN